VVAIAVGVMLGALSTLGVTSALADPLTWSPEQQVGDSSDYLYSLACPAAGDCVAVGNEASYNGAGWAIVANETNGVWGSPEAVSLPADAGSPDSSVSGLYSVSCSSVGNCAAVGYYSDLADRPEPMTVLETNGVWGSATDVTLPPDNTPNTFAGLVSVSCPSDHTCTAVGNYAADHGSSYPEEGFALTEVNGTWNSGVELTLPAYSLWGSGVAAVDCTAADDCEAVGSVEDEQDAPMSSSAFSVTETSGVWGAASEPAVWEPSDLSISTVSCWAAGDCMAGGSIIESPDGASAPAVMDEADGVWDTANALGLPDGANSNDSADINSVSCPDAQQCMAVGSYVDYPPDGDSPLVYYLDQGVSVPAGLTNYYPDTRRALAASCSAAAVCTVLGGSSIGPGSWVISTPPPAVEPASAPDPSSTKSPSGPVGTGAAPGPSSGVAASTNVSLRCIVPRLFGDRLSRARRELRRAHCSVGAVTFRTDRGRAGPLRVFGQSARSRSVHQTGYRVDLRLRRL
jgi:hypothetical protein